MTPKKGYPVIFHGVRGSIPTPAATHLRYGGNTACIEIRLGPDHRLLLDCGTGLRSVAVDRSAGPGGPSMRFDVLISHFHSDHLAGLPFFEPLYDPASRFTFHGFGWEKQDLQTTLQETMTPPRFPIRLENAGAALRFVDLADDPVTIADLTIRFTRLRHPQGVTAYRLERAGRSLVYATDHECGDPDADRALREFATGADILVHDAHYTPAEYPRHRDWGHSTWRHAVEAAQETGAGRLILFHHHPDRTDSELDAIAREAKQEFPGVEVAREGMEILL